MAGSGDDIYVTFSATDRISEAANGGTDTVQSFDGVTTLGANLENLILFGSSSTRGNGNELNNQITGNSLNNFLNGFGGNDTLIGGTGDDTMTGGSGNDLFFVDSSGDVVTEAANGGRDKIFSDINLTLGANVEDLQLNDSPSTGVNGTGNELDNEITGNNFNNILDGLDGNDRLFGGSGNDTLRGGFGDDLLTGEIGNDRLRGQAGNDTLNAGSGFNSYVFTSTTPFNSADFGVDTIVLFSQFFDKIVLGREAFGLQSAVGSGFSVASEFATVANDAAAVGSGARIVYSDATNNLFFNQNGTADGFGTGGQFATITARPSLVLAATDFVIEA
ncbi:calcium-binding protein [Gloeocapsa sp. BRSZ]